jgi:hypothetical protein
MDSRIKQNVKNPNVISKESAPEVKKPSGQKPDSIRQGSSRSSLSAKNSVDEDMLSASSNPKVSLENVSPTAQLHMSPPASSGVSLYKQSESKSVGKQVEKTPPTETAANMTEHAQLSRGANNLAFSNPNRPEVLYKNQSVQTDISLPNNKAYEVTIRASVPRGDAARMSSVSPQGQEYIAPTYPESMQIALEIVPKFAGDIYQDIVVSPKGPLDLKTTEKTKREIAGIFNKFSVPTGIGLLSVQEAHLNELWGNGNNHNRHNSFIRELKSCQGVKVSWSDSSGRTRTMSSPLRRIFKKFEHNLDVESTHTHIGPAFMRTGAGSRGYIKTDAVTVLTINCLRRGDYENLGRICAGDGADIINNLLDDKNIGHGPIFTEPFIWPLLAYGAARVSSDVGNNADPLKALTKSFANFLRYHRSNELKHPYPEITKAMYESGRLNGDSLANNPKAFADCIEKIWESLCPDRPIDDILRTDANVMGVKQKLGTTIVNLVFAAVNTHLGEIENRRKEYNDFVSTLVSTAASVPTDFATGAAGTAGAGLASGTITKFCDILLSASVSKYSSVHQDVKPDEMRERYSALYEMVTGNHSTAGRFIISQPIFKQSEIDALRVDLASARSVREEKNEEVRRAGTIRVQWAEDLGLSDASLKAIFSARQDAGDAQEEMFLAVDNMNPLKATSKG